MSGKSVILARSLVVLLSECKVRFGCVRITRRAGMSVQYQKHYFNVDEYYRMAEVGLLSRDDRVELIEGEIVEMSPIGSTHGGTVKRSSAFLNRKLGDAVIVSVQDPIRLNDFSEPQPDLALLKPRKDFYSKLASNARGCAGGDRSRRHVPRLRSQREAAAVCSRGHTGSLVDGFSERRHRSSLTAQEWEVPKGPTTETRQDSGIADNPQLLLQG